jgi:hypothetical protein
MALAPDDMAEIARFKRAAANTVTLPPTPKPETTPVVIKPESSVPAAGSIINQNTVRNADGTVTQTTTTADGKGNTNTKTETFGSPNNPMTGQPQSTTSNGLTSEQIKQENTRTALQDLTAQLSLVGLSGLVDVINTSILNNQTSAQIADTVRASAEYKTRFPGMAALAAKGQAVNEATYISMEQGFTQTIRAYGLPNTFATTSALGTMIANQVSPTEFNQRVDAAANRVEKNPDVMAAMQQYYPAVSKAGVISYLLDPSVGMDIINKQVRASEIGAAALGAGFTQFDLTKNINAADVAGNLTTQVGSEDLQTLKKEFGQASILNQTQQRLADIEGGAYTSETAIQAAVVGNASAQLESQRRAAREAARFGGAGSQISRTTTVSNI